MKGEGGEGVEVERKKVERESRWGEKVERGRRGEGKGEDKERRGRADGQSK